MACGPIPDQGWNLCPCIGGGFLTTGPPGKFYISSFEKCLFKSFAHFLIRLVVFCCFWVNIFLCRLCVGCFFSWANFLWDIQIEKKPGLCSRLRTVLSNLGPFTHLIWKWKCSLFTSVWLFATPWTVACQAPLSMEFSRKEYWSGLPFPSAGDLPDPGIELACFMSKLHWQVGSLPLVPPGKPNLTITWSQEHRLWHQEVCNN